MKRLRGYLLLLVWLILTGIELALAAEVQLEWDTPPPERGVTLTHLRKRLPDGSTVFLTQSLGTTASVDLPPGTHIIVATDFSPQGWSAFSDPVEVTIPLPLPPAWSLQGNILTTGDGDHIRLTIQFSKDLWNWTDLPFPAARFYRIKAANQRDPLPLF